MGKELEALEPSVLLEFIDGLLKRYENKTDYNIYITKDWLLEIKKAIKRLEAIDNAEPSEALKLFKEFKGILLENIVLVDTDLQKFNTIKQALLKAEKEHNSVNLLMQELDCKDFADLRKYARCGYEKLNKKYLKWEDLEFTKEVKEMKVKLGDNTYEIEYYICNALGLPQPVVILKTSDFIAITIEQFFNDLHLERVEE